MINNVLGGYSAYEMISSFLISEKQFAIDDAIISFALGCNIENWVSYSQVVNH